MTNRERMLRVFRGEEIDQVPFVHVDNLVGLNTDIWAMLGRENVGISRWSSITKLVNQECRWTTEKFVSSKGIPGVRNTIHTSKGSLYEEKLYRSDYGAPALTKHFVTDEEDYPILMEYFKDLLVLPDVDTYMTDVKELGDDGVPFAVLSRTPYQKLWTELVSIEDLAEHMVECPELVEECCNILADHLRKMFDIVAALSKEIDIPIVNIPENITAPLIGKEKYRKYCMPFYPEFKEKVGDAKISVITHLDGELKGIWKEIGESAIDGIDSFTPPPTGDTTVGEAMAMWPDKVIMCNFPSSVHLCSQEEIYATAKQIMKEGGSSGRLWMQISENVPKDVWKTSFPPILQAIKEFGKP